MARKLKISFDDIKTKALREGSIQGIEMSNPNIISPVSGSSTIGGISLPPTECFLLESISMSVAKGYSVLQTTNYNSPNNASVGENSIRHSLSNSTITIPCNSVLLAGSTISSNVRNGDGTTPLSASCYYSGIRITNDLNFNADKVMLWIGDSVTRGSSMGSVAYSNITTPATSCSEHFAFITRDYLNSIGEDVRLVIKAMGSYTSTMMNYHIKGGWCNIEQADYIFYQMGINDATSGISDLEFTSNINNLVEWKKRTFPKSKLILVGATPLNNNTQETRLTQLRGIMTTFVSEQNNINYLSLANSFDRTNITNYHQSDGIHPNVATNRIIGDYISTIINTI